MLRRDAVNGLVLQIGGLEQHIDFAPMHGPRHPTGQACGDDGRIGNVLGHFNHQINIAAFLVVMHPRTKQGDLRALTQHRVHGALDGLDLGGCQAHGVLFCGSISLWEPRPRGDCFGLRGFSRRGRRSYRGLWFCGSRALAAITRGCGFVAR